MVAVIDIPEWSRKHTVGVDLALAATICAGQLVFEATDAGEVGAKLDAVDFVACAVAIVLIMTRRRSPIVVALVALVVGAWSLVPEDGQPVLLVALCLTLYTLASTTARRIAWPIGIAAAGVLFVTATIVDTHPWYDGDNLELIAWAGVATAAGDAVRSRRSALVARHERAEQAHRDEARRQVVEERLRIARELHDVVAHHIAVINVQAGVASHLLRDDPAGAEDALAHVRTGAATVLDELGGILSVMRRPDEWAASVDPLPTLDQLDELIAGFGKAGLQVEWHTSGARAPVAPAIGLAAYRVVQEALTNAQRHGVGGSARLRVDYLPDTLTIEVTNRTGSVVANGVHRGHGLVGMHERVAAAQGTIDVGEIAGGEFRVAVALPMAVEAR